MKSDIKSTGPSKIQCPMCGSKKVARILYGLIDVDDELWEQKCAGKIVFGGCCVEPTTHHCNKCKFEFTPSKKKTNVIVSQVNKLKKSALVTVINQSGWDINHKDGFAIDEAGAVYKFSLHEDNVGNSLEQTKQLDNIQIQHIIDSIEDIISKDDEKTELIDITDQYCWLYFHYQGKRRNFKDNWEIDGDVSELMKSMGILE